MPDNWNFKTAEFGMNWPLFLVRNMLNCLVPRIKLSHFLDEREAGA
jgi:hypothetical protein